MAFTSLTFLVFLTAVIVINYCLPQRWRWAFLLAASYYFYLNWQPIYAVLLITTTGITYITAKLLNRSYQNRASRKLICWTGCILPLGALAIFKYYGFVTDNISALLETLDIKIVLPKMQLLLPIGISFYTFSAIGYLIDIYRRKYKPERNFGIFCLFIAFFAQITSGPIPRGDQLLPQLKMPDNLNYDNVMRGFRTMLWGFFMKLCVADRITVYVDTIYGNIEAHNGGSILLASILYTIQIYCDFAGYSFIAIGAARMLGLRLIDNFRRPYLAKNIKDFWGRWHISLSTWFRDYVYIPLGGNRVSKTRHKLNLMLTFLVSGLWHGAAWNYILWGGLHGTGQIAEKLGAKLKLSPPPIVKICLTFVFVSICWMFFRLSSVDEVFHGLGKILFDFGVPFIDSVLFYGLITLLIVITKDVIDEYFPNMKIMNSNNFWISNISTGLFAAIIVLFGSFGAGSFIYFQF